MSSNDKLVVRKSNQIVQKTINRFTKSQNQLMAILLGKFVNLTTDEVLDTEITVGELLESMGLTDGTENYEKIRNAVRMFGERGSVGIYRFDEKKQKYRYDWMPFFKKISVLEGENKVVFSWNDLMKEQLVNLKKNYTQYLADDYLNLTSLYGQNLYEQMKSIQGMVDGRTGHRGYGKFEVDYLRKLMNVEDKYEENKIFRRDVIKRGLDDINAHTDLYVECSPIKRGAIEFWVYEKDQYVPYKGLSFRASEWKEIIRDKALLSKAKQLAVIKEMKHVQYNFYRNKGKGQKYSDYEIVLNFSRIQKEAEAKEIAIAEEERRRSEFVKYNNARYEAYVAQESEAKKNKK